jgi:hypothetical protein
LIISCEKKTWREESVRLANVAAVAQALAVVNRYRVNFGIIKNIENIENRSDFTGNEPDYKNSIDRLDKTRAYLKEARADLDKLQRIICN